MGRRSLALSTITLVVLVILGLGITQALALRRHLLAAGRYLQGAETALQTATSGGQAFRISAADVDSTDAQLAAAESELAQAGVYERRLAPALAVAGRLPVVGASAGAVTHGLAFAHHATAGARLLLAGLRPVAAARDAAPDGTNSIARMTGALATGAPTLLRARSELDAAEAERREIDEHAVLPPLRGSLAQLSTWDRNRPLLQSDLALLTRLPPVLQSLLGYGTPRTYALLGQNSAELRPTGGFLGTMGIVHVSDGKVTGQDYRSIYQFEPDNSGKLRPLPPAPLPLVQHLGITAWHIQDSNWSPNFQVSAQDLRALLDYDDGIKVDGVIAFDSYAVQDLLRRLGPVDVTIDGQTEHFTAENWLTLTTQLVFLDPTHPDSTEGKNRVLAPLLQTVITRVYSASGEQVDGLVESLRMDVVERHVLFQMVDAATARFLYDYQADGRIQVAAGDGAIYPVEANLSYTKIGPFIQEATSLEVWCSEAGACTRAHLTLTWKNTVTAAQIADPLNRITGDQWDAATARLISTPGAYGFYERVYTPAGTALAASSGTQAEPIGQSGDGDNTVFGTYLSIAPGETAKLELDLLLPATAGRAPGFQLDIPKQPGTQGRSIDLIVHSPQLPQSNLAFSREASGGAFRYAGPFDENLRFAIRP